MTNFFSLEKINELVLQGHSYVSKLGIRIIDDKNYNGSSILEGQFYDFLELLEVIEEFKDLDYTDDQLQQLVLRLYGFVENECIYYNGLYIDINDETSSISIDLSGYVKKDGVQQTITSILDFVVSPLVPNPTTNFQALNLGTANSLYAPIGAEGITALTGDGSAAGVGSVPFTLAIVNSNTGSFGSASNVGQFTVNGKGLIIAASNIAIQITESQVTGLVSDLAGKQASLGFTPENVANKATSFGILNDILYPTTQAVSTALDAYALLSGATFTGAVTANAGLLVPNNGLTVGTTGGNNVFLSSTSVKIITSGGGETDYGRNLISFKNLTGGFRQDIIPTAGTTSTDSIFSLPNKNANDTFAMISDLSGFGGGSVTSLTDSTTNGVAITWTTRTTTPVATVVLGDIAPNSISTGNIVNNGTFNNPTYTSSIAAWDGSHYLGGLSGTGFIKLSGSTISFDNSTYLTATIGDARYLTLATPNQTVTQVPTITGGLLIGVPVAGVGNGKARFWGNGTDSGGSTFSVEIAPSTGGSLNVTGGFNYINGYLGLPAQVVINGGGTLNVVTTSIVTPRGPMFDQFSSDTLSSRFYLRKARGAGTTSIVTGDVISNLVSSAYDGTNFIDIAQFRTTSTGTVATGNISAYTEIQTALAGVLSTVQTWGADGTSAIGGGLISGRTLSLITASTSVGALAIKATNIAGYSSLDALDYLGVNQFGIGYANPSASISALAGTSFITSLVPINFCINTVPAITILANKSVGIGTVTPGALLQVSGHAPGAIGLVNFMETGSYGSSGGAGFTMFADNASAITNGSRLGFTVFGGAVNSTHTINNSTSIAAFATEDWTGTAAGAALAFNATPNGSLSRTEVMRLFGTVRVAIGSTTDNGTDKLQVSGTVIATTYRLTGSSSGTISLVPQAAAGTYNFNLPTTAGTAGQVLTSQAGGSTAMTWTNIYSKTHTIFTPTTGGTVTLVNNQYNIINPAGSLVALTVTLPSSPSNNDCVFIKYTQAVTTVTYSGGTVSDAIITPSLGTLVVLVYDSGTTTWY